MRTLTRTFGVGFAIALGGSYLALAQQPPAGPPPPMSFFVTSAGSGKGADLGGIAGADRICQTLATAAGSTKTWHAYLSAAGRERPGGGQRARSDRRRAVVQREGRADRAERRRPARRHARAGAPRQQHQQDDGAHRKGRSRQRRRRHAEPARHDHRVAARRHRVHRRGRSYLRQLLEQRDDRRRAARAPRSHRRRQHLVELDAPQPRLQPGESGRHRRRRTVLLLRDQLVDDQFVVTCPYCGEQVEIYLEPDVRGTLRAGLRGLLQPVARSRPRLRRRPRRRGRTRGRIGVIQPSAISHLSPSALLHGLHRRLDRTACRAFASAAIARESFGVGFRCFLPGASTMPPLRP